MPTTTIFNSAGTYLFTLPANIDINTPMTVTLEGADGGDRDMGGGSIVLGGQGARVVGTLSLTGMTPGVTQIQVNVGGKGVSIVSPNSSGGLQAGGFNGGGQGGGSTNGSRGGGGGGATDLRIGGTFALADRKVVAGGGGGAGGNDVDPGSPNSRGGAGGAATGQVGFNGTTAGFGRGGGGGTAAAGGAAGTSAGTASNNATAGALGLGGSGSSHSSVGYAAGGGGGGGNFGGGGGGGADNTSSSAGGGGGGSSYTGGLLAVTTNSQGNRSQTLGDGWVSLAYNTAPNQSALTQHANGDDTAGVNVAWAFSDPDPGDTQSKADVQWRVGTGAFTQVLNAVTTAQTYTFPAGTFGTFIGQQVEWQVRTYDAAGKQGPWSTSGFFTPRTEPGTAPTVTVPALNSNTPAVVVTAGAGTFRYFRLTVLDVTLGTTTDYGWQDAGSLVTSANFSVPTYPYVNGRTYTFKAQVSPVTDIPVPSPLSTGVTVTAAINAPLTPVISGLIVNALSGSVSFTITNPGSDPNPPTSNRVYRQDLTNSAPEQRIAVSVPLNSTFTDWQPALNVLYRYRVEALGANGAAASSA